MLLFLFIFLFSTFLFCYKACHVVLTTNLWDRLGSRSPSELSWSSRDWNSPFLLQLHNHYTTLDKLNHWPYENLLCHSVAAWLIRVASGRGRLLIYSSSHCFPPCTKTKPSGGRRYTAASLPLQFWPRTHFAMAVSFFEEPQSNAVHRWEVSFIFFFVE